MVYEVGKGQINVVQCLLSASWMSEPRAAVTASIATPQWDVVLSS